MSEQKINFSDYKSSGVYFLEYDNSVVNTTSVQSALRLAVGFNMTGPFNRPVYIENTKDIDDLFGPINRKLERKGCYTNRNLRTMVSKAPVYALNLLKVDTNDKVGYSLLSLDPNTTNVNTEMPYADMYDRSRFWVADDLTFVNKGFGKDKSGIDTTLESGAMFGVGNCGTKDLSVIIRKAENISGYNITFLDWYGTEEAIPYKWVRPTDYVSDYFVEVYCISGKWDASTYESYAQDPTWSEYFTKDGLKKDKLGKFLRLDAVTLVGSWTGFLFPEFTDKQGNPKSIDYLINKTCNKTGLMFGINTNALETVALGTDASGNLHYYLDEDGTGKYSDSAKSPNYIPDLIGNTVDASTQSIADFLSYHFDEDVSTKLYSSVQVLDTDIATVNGKTTFLVRQEDASDIAIGDYVRSQYGTMSKITKKRVYNKSYTTETTDTDKEGAETTKTITEEVRVAEFTVISSIKFTSKDNKNYVEIHKKFTDVYSTLKFIPLNGLMLSNKHLPGYDSSGAIDVEAGVDKIYSMIEDDGIRKGLLNRDIIDYRYIVDTMGFGLKTECGAKVHLTRLAKDKGSCTAICSLPSMSSFAASDKPFFGAYYIEGTELRPTFDVAYIAQGGNSDMLYDASTEMFSLPSEGNGAQYCGFFAPYLKYTDGTQTILVPPAADVSNVFMNKFLGGNPYATVANLNGVISGSSSDLEYMFDTADRDSLEPAGINPIIKRNGYVMIYGDRTAYQTVNSDLSFLHVREILNLIEAQCRTVLDNYVFTYNTATTRAEIVSRINPILSAMKDSDALARYEIQCDETNNPADVINEKFCIVDIGVWINQNMEKIVTRITLNRSTTA
jgi:hypothetical protein